MSESNSGLTDDVAAELVPDAEEAVVEAESGAQRVVVDFEDAWTAQSSHGVLLPHFVPSQDYSVLESDPAERTDVADDQTW